MKMLQRKSPASPGFVLAEIANAGFAQVYGLRTIQAKIANACHAWPHENSTTRAC
jgi:hypothetical protein